MRGKCRRVHGGAWKWDIAKMEDEIYDGGVALWGSILCITMGHQDGYELTCLRARQGVLLPYWIEFG